MPTNRRNVLLAALPLPMLSACATTNINQLRERPVAALARDLGVCSASYAVLRAGASAAPIAVSGCDAERTPADAIFQAASLTKPVAAYAVLRLVKAGQLDLQATVSHYLPNGYRHFHSALARTATGAHDMVTSAVLDRITVGQLLNHTSGLPNWTSSTLSLAFEPGARWGYSGEGYVLLQAVVEAVTQQNFADYLHTEVFAALGMADSSLVWRDAFAERAVSGKTIFGTRANGRFRQAVAAASLYTTAADYARFMAALLADDTLLALTLESPVALDRTLGLQWGHGWGVEQAPGGPYIWQWGNNPGFRSFAMASAVSKDGFVILTNNDRGMPLAASVAHTVWAVEHNAFRLSWVG